jgi:hypothetical protein
MTIFEYVALNNPNGAKNVVNKFGHKAIRRPDMLARQLADTVNRHGKQAMYEIASVHPDLDLITHFNEFNAEKEGKSSCGCKDKKEDSLFSSAEGQAIKKAVEDISRKQEVAESGKKEKSEKSELLIIGAVAVIGLALVMKK